MKTSQCTWLLMGGLVGSLLSLVNANAAAASKPVQVYILAGQSNMEGKAKVSLLEYQASQPGTRDLFQHWQKDGKWTEREDVWIKFLDRKGKLTVGYGSPKCIGPEMEFGTVVGNRTTEPVLLIKTAWGGRSLFRDFRSPSAGLPPDAVLAKMLADAQKRKTNATMDEIKQPFGAAFREMLMEVNGTLDKLPALFPEYSGQGWKLAGFIWFQGWNDMINAEYTAAYTTNLAHFIRDVRRDLKSPALPFVIAQMGVDGTNANAGTQRFKQAQAAVMEYPEFKGNVALVKTDELWDYEADAVYRKGWRQNLEEWNQVGSDYPYHYLGSVKFMLRAGRAIAEAVLDLQAKTK